MEDAYDFIIIGGKYIQVCRIKVRADDYQLERQARCSLLASHIPQQHLQSFWLKQEEQMPMLRINLVPIAIMQLSRMGPQ